MVRVAFLVCIAVALAACADDSPTLRWSKPGASYEQFVADRSVCVERSRQASTTYYIGGVRFSGKPNVLDSGIFLPCMNDFGYVRDSKGYAAPPGDEIPLGP